MTNYVSTYSIIEAAQRDSGINDLEIDINDAVEWIYECIELIAIPMSYLEPMPIKLSIVDHRGELPRNLHTILGVRTYDTKIPLNYSTDIYYKNSLDTNITVSESFLNNDTLATAPNTSIKFQYKYKTENGYLYTDLKETDLEMAYNIFPIDEVGYPIIPDNISVINACKWFIIERMMYKLWVVGKIPDKVYEKANQERLWYVGKASSSPRIPSLDMMQNLRNISMKMISNPEQIMDGFRTMAEPERLNFSRYW